MDFLLFHDLPLAIMNINALGGGFARELTTLHIIPRIRHQTFHLRHRFDFCGLFIVEVGHDLTGLHAFRYQEVGSAGTHGNAA